jgi:metal-responsive CopG/Arc/MetJ family transcriptional regulator
VEKNSKGKYTTVHIPTVLAEVIDEIMEKEQCAYSSRSEFIKDAIRRFLEHYGYYPRIMRNSNTVEMRAPTPKFNDDP